MKKLIKEIERRIFELYQARVSSNDFEYKNYLAGQEAQLDWVLKELQTLRSSTDRT